MFESDKELKYDTNHAVEIAPRTWWVGHANDNEALQCHTYLIEQGEQSVLIDPGSKITFSNTLRKINEVIPFNHIKYFICHHQDPDITSVLTLIDQMVFREDVKVVTHSLAENLVQHYNFQMPFMAIDSNSWKLSLEDRTLQFCFTPYAHFPGAFTTYDPATKVMFTSDIFGGYSDHFALFAEDDSYLECMKPFHQHYMPSNEILLYALSAIGRYDIETIAPQHGSIIGKELIPTMMQGLKKLDCGLYLLLDEPSDFMKLNNFNETLKNITRTMTLYRDFRDIASALFELIKKEIAVGRLEFYVRDKENSIIHYAEKNSYRGVKVSRAVPAIQKFFDAGESQAAVYRESYELVQYKDGGAIHERLHVPLFLPDQSVIGAVIIMILEEKVEPKQIALLVEQIYVPLQVSIERENMYREIEKERDHIYQRSIRDPLTGLYTRMYMKDVVQKIVDQQDRDKNSNLVAIMVDIDHFKNVNDTWGHNQGDIVLKKMAEKVLEHCRGTDIPIRMGGEEFLVFSQIDEVGALKFAEKLRQVIEEIKWQSPMNGVKTTASLGIALRKLEEPLDLFISRADEALYEAKHRGRNKVCFYPSE